MNNHSFDVDIGIVDMRTYVTADTGERLCAARLNDPTGTT
jgi:hypothetical protein